MATWLKYSLGGLLGLLLCVGFFGYFYLKSQGLVPRYIYETVPPDIPSFARPAVLVLNKTNGFIHREAIPVADEMLSQLAKELSWDIYLTDNAASHQPDLLEQFQLVIWNNTSGDVLTADQRSALQRWIEKGGGWIGLHAAGGDKTYQWNWYGETLLGAQFVGHTMNPQFQDADLQVSDPTLEITAHISSPWRVKQEEWYAFDRNPRDLGYEILLTIDESSYITHGETFHGQDRMLGEHPLVWRHHIGAGRVFYSAIGHTAATYRIEEYKRLIINAMLWASGEQL